MVILAIETSCDDTAIALVEASGGLKQPKFKVLKSLVSSQINIHRPFGGVVPNLAKREHLKNLPILYRKIFGISKSESLISKQSQSSKIKIPEIDLIAVTVGPGLEPALWAGINFAEDLSKKLKKPLIGANHLEGHLYSFLLEQKRIQNQKSPPKADLSQRRMGFGRTPRDEKIKNQKSGNSSRAQNNFKVKFPAVALLVSGGHTILLLMKSLTNWKKLGETRDDAAGEAFDKVARLLKLPYPGGPEIEELSKKGDPEKINFPRPMLNQKNYDFSFSGLKTAVLYFLRDNPRANKTDVAASFQQAVIDVLAKKTMRAAQEFKAKSVMLSGGVAANRALRAGLRLAANNLRMKFSAPPFRYNTDNAAMIGIAAYINHLKKKRFKMSANANLNL